MDDERLWLEGIPTTINTSQSFLLDGIPTNINISQMLCRMTCRKEDRKCLLVINSNGKNRQLQFAPCSCSWSSLLDSQFWFANTQWRIYDKMEHRLRNASMINTFSNRINYRKQALELLIFNDDPSRQTSNSLLHEQVSFAVLLRFFLG